METDQCVPQEDERKLIESACLALCAGLSPQIFPVVDSGQHPVSEEGTEAAAATGVVMLTKCLVIGPDFFADHPFVYDGNLREK
ncbi:hypothetical protein ANCDUO_23417 [Ancylostoma duodenale]|uniref:Uncharacterized protein n=1 Tax=Ancylostoma duodenale TaxID=51022 RepID=A0A0C2C9P0_9BILA|nr:hypothetical protein ANCDUO_23417 [Ancylostoma duodenale]